MDKIIHLKLDAMQKKLDNHKITMKIDDKAKEYLAINGYDSKYGARPLDRLIEKEVGNKIATGLLEGGIKEKSAITISIEDDQIKIL